MKIGYAALHQNTGSSGMVEPHSALINAGVQRLFIDVAFGHEPRAQLEAAIAAIDEGDVLVSATVETLARTPRDLISIASRLDAKGASLCVLQIAGGLPLDTRTVEGRAMLGALAIIHALAPAEPGSSLFETPLPATEARPRGRPVTASNQSGEVTRLRAEGLRATDIAQRLGIGRASVYRILGQGGSMPVAAPAGDTAGRAATLARRLQSAT